MARYALICGIVFNLLLLGFFKYTDFVLENLNLLAGIFSLGVNVPLPHIVLPLALSFVTFQQIAFLCDCYRDSSRTNSSLGNHLHNPSALSHCGARQSAPHSQGETIAQSNTANTKIVLNTAIDSRQDSESSAESNSSLRGSEADEAIQNKNCHTERSEVSINSPSLAEGVRGWVSPNLAPAHPNARGWVKTHNMDCHAESCDSAHNDERMDTSHSLSMTNDIDSMDCHETRCVSSNDKINDTHPLAPSAREGEFSVGGLESANEGECVTATTDSHNDERKDTSALPQYDGLSCHTERSEVSFIVDCHEFSSKNSRNDEGKDTSGNRPQYDKKGADSESSKMDCHETRCVSRNDAKQNKISLNPLDYALFITFFPQLIAGPIVHHAQMMPQFRALKSSIFINYSHIAKGLFIFAMGLFKKVCLADSFAKWANAGFEASKTQVLNCFESWATSLSYTLQLYFDFSGYCDMAIGLGLLFGIRLPLNFNSPYKSLNISAFWRAWHITLGRFLRDYVYINLGGNRNEAHKTSRFYPALNRLLTLRNLFIVAFLSGVWHGAGWGFVIWGSLHGVAMVIHRIYVFFIAYLREKSRVVSLAYSRESRASLADSMENAKTTNATITNANSSILSEKSGLCSFSRGDKAKTPIAQAKSKLPYFSPKQAQRSFFRKDEFAKLLRILNSRFYKILAWLLTFNFINLAWVFFRAESVESALNVIKGMFSFHIVLPEKLESKLHFLVDFGVSFDKWAVGIEANSYIVLPCIMGGIALCLACKNTIELAKNFRTNLAYLLFTLGLLLASYIVLGISQAQAFLYFNF